MSEGFISIIMNLLNFREVMMSGGESHSSLTCGNPPTTNPNVSETGRGTHDRSVQSESLWDYLGGGEYTLQYYLIIQPF